MEDKVFSHGELTAIIQPLLEKYRMNAAYLFGSYARNDARPESDIDVLVDGGPSVKPLSVYALGEELRDVTGKDVDVFEMSELEGGPFKSRALGEAIAL